MSVFYDALTAVCADLERFDPACPSLHFARGVLATSVAIPKNAKHGNCLSLPEEEVIALWDSGHGAPELAAKYGCSDESIYRLIRRYGRTGRGRPRGPRVGFRGKHYDKFPSIAAAYAEGKSLLECAQEFGCSTAIVRAACLQVGVPMRPKGAARRHDPNRITKIMDMREEGKTIEEIGAALGITRERVRQIVVKAGLRAEFEPRPLTPEQQAALNDYADGMSLILAASKFGVGPATFKKRLELAGIPVRPSARHIARKQRIAQKAAQIARLYQEGVSSAGIADQVGLPSQESVYRWLGIAGVKPDRRAAA